MTRGSERIYGNVYERTADIIDASYSLIVGGEGTPTAVSHANRYGASMGHFARRYVIGEPDMEKERASD